MSYDDITRLFDADKDKATGAMIFAPSCLYADDAVLIWVDCKAFEEDVWNDYTTYNAHVKATDDCASSHYDRLYNDAAGDYAFKHLNSFCPYYIRWAGFDDKPRFNCEGKTFIDGLPQGWVYTSKDSELEYITKDRQQAVNAFRDAVRARLEGDLTVASSYFFECGDFFRREAVSVKQQEHLD